MTDAIEEKAKELAVVWHSEEALGPWFWDGLPDYAKRRFRIIAKHVLRGEIEARIDERKMFYDLLGNAESWGTRQDARLDELEKQGKELK